MRPKKQKMILVVYCPCGHTGYVPASEIPANILQDPRRASAPQKHSDHCPTCKEYAEDDRRRMEYLIDGFDI